MPRPKAKHPLSRLVVLVPDSIPREVARVVALRAKRYGLPVVAADVIRDALLRGLNSQLADLGAEPRNAR